MIVIDEIKATPAPIPDRALPTISTSIDEAAAETMDPCRQLVISERASSFSNTYDFKHRYGHLEYILSIVNC